MIPTIRSSTSRKKLNKACDIFPMAKQTRGSFLISSNKPSHLIELIHCDLWRPYSVPSLVESLIF